MRCSPVVSALTVNANNATVLGSIPTSVHILVLKTVHKKIGEQIFNQIFNFLKTKKSIFFGMM
jgi:hypothetical protein